MDFQITDVAVPLALLRDAARFGGRDAGDLRRGALVVRDGVIAGMADDTLPDLPQVAGGGIVLPGLVEPHIHLDKCHTVDRIPAVGGDLIAAIRAQEVDIARWTPGDLRKRAEIGLAELVAAGCTVARTHVDWGRPGDPAAVPLAWPVFAELAQDWADRITLDRAALAGIDLYADPDRGAAVAARVAADGGTLGAFVLGHPGRAKGIANIFAHAERHGLALDFHVDEGLLPGFDGQALDGLGMIADAALAAHHAGPVLCGHAVALMNHAGDDLARLIDRIAQARLAVVALPPTNLYLQGRSTGTPDRRGITRLHELAARGVTVAIGTDNVRDAFMPVGRHDPLATLAGSVAALHLDPPFGRWLGLITTDAARAMGRAPVFIDGARVADLILTDAPNLPGLLSPPVARRALPHPV